MSRLVLWFLPFFCVGMLFGVVPKWTHYKEFILKKDEKAKVVLTDRIRLIRDEFEFSWTLYDNTNLVVHTKFRNYPRQIVLSLRRGLEMYHQPILAFIKDPLNDSVDLYLNFKEYRSFDGTVVFDTYIMDKTARVEIEYIPDR
ncbi:hypothetical protein [Campylobacter lanienae]|uniref:hypothetical protein n=1 Tax=Campylobacter lanienae TaxID=75658 RepID=UPI0021BF5662|nr:hypothetical protein [Campylobacter lanienae]